MDDSRKHWRGRWFPKGVVTLLGGERDGKGESRPPGERWMSSDPVRSCQRWSHVAPCELHIGPRNQTKNVKSQSGCIAEIAMLYCLATIERCKLIALWCVSSFRVYEI
jgi:hypothetical protein